MKKRNWLTSPWLFLSLLVTITAIVPVAYYAIPHVLRWRMVQGLVASDISVREKSLNYLIRLANEDPLLLEKAIDQLIVEDQSNFLQIVSALDHAGQWRHSEIPQEYWLRWISILASDTPDDSRINAIQQLTESLTLAYTPKAQSLLHTLANDDQPDVRYNALVAAAELIATAPDPAPYLTIIANATTDKEAAVARQAWLMIGLLNPDSTVSTKWRNKTAIVAEAIIWALLKLHPDQPAPAIQALKDMTLTISHRALCAYALYHSSDTSATSTLADTIMHHALNINEDNQVLLWRSLLSIKKNADSGREAINRFLTGVSDDPLSQPLYRPLILAALNRYGPHEGFQDNLNKPQTHYDMLALLAVLEGADAITHLPNLPNDSPPLITLIHQSVSAEADPNLLRPLFASDNPAMRDRACLLASQRFSDEQNAKLIESLLNDYNDDAKSSGAILSGLTGLQKGLLIKKYQHEDVWIIKQIMAAGLWMQGVADMKGAFSPKSMLTRNDIPKSTVLLVLLHREPVDALDYILNPHGDLDPDLINLLDLNRWWPVLSNYLPDDGYGGPPPELWLWADPALQEFQLELLCNWYLINRNLMLTKGD